MADTMTPREAMEGGPEAIRWAAVEQRDADADGTFVFAVRTTGIYCRPSCPAKRPLRKNVRYYALAREAARDGFRPCKRCRPDEISSRQRAARAVEAACEAIVAADVAPSLARLAEDALMSPHHFHRTFKAHVGVTPKVYADAVRHRRSVEALGIGARVADAAFASGYNSLSRFHEATARRFGMSPSSVAAGGLGELILTSQIEGPLGIVTAAFSSRGVASVVLSDRPEEGIGTLFARFPRALILDGGEAAWDALEAVIAAIEEPELAEELPLDVRGTAFEERVWAALRKIPAGTTATYAEVAAAIGAPTSHRAVARACGANKHAVVVPCHRVVRSDGGLGGYRWGLERKQALLAREKGTAEKGTAEKETSGA